MNMTRNEFLRTLVRAGAGAVGATVLYACGSDDNGGGADAPPASCTGNGTSATIAANHGHQLTVSKDDVTAAAEKTYDITGSSPHTHMVTVTAAQFATLASNQSITVVSTNGGGHDHSVTISCR